MRVNRFITWLAFVALLIAGILAFSQTGARPFTISISTAHPSIKSGSPVVVNVTLTNTLDRTIGIAQSDPQSDYDVTVTDIKGAPAPFTAHGRELHDPYAIKQVFSNVVRPLKPQEAMTESLEVSQIFD